MREEYPVNEETNPLGIPRGSVRSLITIGIVAVSGYLVIEGREVPEWWQILTGAATATYFGVRTIAPRVITRRPPEVDLLEEARQDGGEHA